MPEDPFVNMVGVLGMAHKRTSVSTYMLLSRKLQSFPCKTQRVLACSVDNPCTKTRTYAIHDTIYDIRYTRSQLSDSDLFPGRIGALDSDLFPGCLGAVDSDLFFWLACCSWLRSISWSPCCSWFRSFLVMINVPVQNHVIIDALVSARD